MQSDWILIGIVVAALMYFSNYAVLGMLLGAIMFFVFIVSVIVAAQPAKEPKSSNVLEPIIIESTRGPAYRIPSDMEIRYNRKAKLLPKYATMTSNIGRTFGLALRGVFGIPKKKKEEKK